MLCINLFCCVGKNLLAKLVKAPFKTRKNQMMPYLQRSGKKFGKQNNDNYICANFKSKISF
ncbi:hypothetical protein B6N25_10835 [Sphingobacteriales bacterium TSM_CSS]|nr:hypothetical protein B6N25_10835 [Sphingobacteriales bacterium TSM_CSS]